MPSLEVIEQLGTSPISEAAPAGENARYEPEYEALEAEIEKLSALSGGEVDWRVVVDQASSVLGSKSKDLLVGCRLSLGLLEQDGLGGLAAGLRVINDLCTNFWDDMFPALRRLNGRRQSFEWLAERVANWLGRNELTEAHFEQLGAVIDAMDTVSQYCDERMEEVQGSGLFSLIRELRQAQDRITPSEPEAAPEPVAEAAPAADDWSSPSEPAAAPMQQSAAPAAVQSAAPLNASGDFRQARAEAFKRIRDLANFFATAEPHSPIAPMLRRVARWEAMGYRELYSELLKHVSSGQATLWETLGVGEDGDAAPPPATMSAPSSAPTMSADDGWGTPDEEPRNDGPVNLGGRDDW
ncbi:MAG: type VI secretion system ImpA family N-terminal domain-containing protein [Planctomycetota bacterium]|jgi:type VI secretion system protein VasJ|nr:type VI secretion system ImpA family N-terminal domain-containing protein [Planctomycetota bacterium]